MLTVAAKLLRAAALEVEVVVAVIKLGSVSVLQRAVRQCLAVLRKEPRDARTQHTEHSKQAGSSLCALTTAALALPGLIPSAGLAAEGGAASFQYGHYQESARQLYGDPTPYKPIQVDSLHGSGSGTLLDRLTFSFNYFQDTWSGATPVTSAPYAFGGNRGSTSTIATASPMIRPGGFVDSQLRPYAFNPLTGIPKKDTRIAHTLSTASPETRTQGDFKLGYEWDEAAVSLGGGISQEPDYYSWFANTGGRWDFNQKLTSVDLGFSYTNSDTSAKLNSAAQDYIDFSPYKNQIDIVSLPSGARRTLYGSRQDWSTHIGLTQILTKNSLASTSIGFSRGTGYMENPYKVVEFVFVDPRQDPIDFGVSGVPALLQADVRAVLEQRPNERNQVTWDARYIHYIEPLNAAIHAGYRFYHDNWGIDAHTFEADWGQPLGAGWTITPKIRYYSQSAADFYRPYYIFKQATPTLANGDLAFNKVPVSQYSSDQRLSGYGALSGGVTITKQFAKGIKLDLGFEYYTHQGSLKLGGGGEGSYSDFDFYTINAGIGVDLSAAFQPGSNHAGHEGHAGHGLHAGVHVPAGVMFGHMLSREDEFMVGYRYMFSQKGGHLLHGIDAAGDAAVVANGCAGTRRCGMAPGQMTMHMHMLDLMYAPTDWLNLMLMPQFVDMQMPMRYLAGGDTGNAHQHGSGRSSTGGIGDTGVYALLKLFDDSTHHVHLSLGFSAPTGDEGKKLIMQAHNLTTGEMITRREFVHYDMQLGSGTWDFKPSLTYTGHWDRWSWGGQLSGVQRIDHRNGAGYVLGDLFQSTAWGSYSLQDWLSASVRGVYTWQDKIKGQYNGLSGSSGPMDFPANYGGRYWDVGFGLNAMVTGGAFQGNHFAVEWLQPVYTDVNGYQLEPQGTLSATWGLAF